MLNLKGPDGNMGVIIARFQTPYLTDGHRELIETVRGRHSKFAILIGISPVIPSTKNPLDYETRAKMILDAYPGTEIHPIRDTRDDAMWSKNVDTLLRVIHPHEKIVLYGSRDSFIGHYTGKFKTAELDEIMGVSATLAREQAFHQVRTSDDFRAGICYATANQYRKNVLCVDVAPMWIGKAHQVLLARREEDGGLWRFIGGHVDVGRETAEAAGRREVTEESGIEVGRMEYIGSTPINDWKYNGTPDGVFTIFFAGHYNQIGMARGADDIDEVKWHHTCQVDERIIVPEHHVLVDMLLKHYDLRGKEQILTPCGDDAFDVQELKFTTVNGKKMVTSPVEREKITL